jgi:iron(III) transport system permease protein
MSVIPVNTRRQAARFIEIAWPQAPQWSWPRWHTPQLILLLLASLVALLMLLPPIYLLVRTVEAGQAALDILLRPSTIATLGRTLLLASSVTAASALIAVPIAWLTACTDLPGRRFWTISAALPLVLPSYVVAFLLVSILGPRGLLQQTLQPIFGIERLPSIYGFWGAFLALTLMTYPYTLITVRAALRRMDPSLLEAARSMGLSPWQAFWRVTLPQLRPGIIAGSLLVILYVLRDFGAVAMLRYDTFTRVIYIQYQSFMNRSLAATLALVLVVITAVILYMELKSRGKARYCRNSAGAARQMQPVRLGKWRWPALAFVVAVVLVALVLPASGLIYWVMRGLANGQVLSSLWLPAWNSVTVSLLAALLAVAAALPVAILSVRRPGRLSHFIERLTYSGFALPGIVVALALVFFGAAYARPLYQTVAMLLAAYVVLFVPQAVGSARASLLQVSPGLEEAGRSLGQGPWLVFRRITLPLLSPGVLAGGALVFLTVMKELPATLLLGPTGFSTLSTAVWSNISEALFAQAAAPALLLVLLSSIPLAFLSLREK